MEQSVKRRAGRLHAGCRFAGRQALAAALCCAAAAALYLGDVFLAPHVLRPVARASRVCSRFAGTDQTRRTGSAPATATIALVATAMTAVAAGKEGKRLPKKKKKPAGMGFSMPKVSDAPAKNFDTGPKLLEIVRYPHPSLRRPNVAVTEFDGKLKQLSENLFKTMYETDTGCGLAAPQCGVNLRVMVYNYLRTPEAIDPAGETVFVNPVISARSEEQDEEYEACLSFPGFDGPVVRPIWVEVEAVDLEGKPYTRRLEGEEARVFQHEFDHLEGIVYVDRVDEKWKETLKPNLKKLISEYAAGGGKEPML